MRPNVLLIVFDTARADAFEPYGAPRGATPAVADLAAGGVVVPTAYATSNWTLPSHASMFSGLLPGPLGLSMAAPPRAAVGRHADRMLASVLRRDGYETRAISSNLWVTKRHGFAAGFDVFVEIGGRRKHRTREGIGGRLRWAADAILSTVDDGLSDAWTLIDRWIAQLNTGPFFWFVNLMECHSPYLPPRPYNDLPVAERIRAADDARVYQSHDGFLRVCLGQEEVPENSLRRMKHLYARAVRSMDDWLARVLDALASRGRLDDTLVLVTSDHGENLGDAHLLGHALSLDDRLIRVPLVLSGPGASAPDAHPFSLIGLPALIAGAVGIETHPWMEDGAGSGVAIAQNDGFSGMAPDAVLQLTRAWHVPASAIDRLRERMASATDGRWKLVRSGDGERFHDLSTDPLEERPSSAPDEAVAARLRGALDRVAAFNVPAATGNEAENAAIEDRLRTLGYL